MGLTRGRESGPPKYGRDTVEGGAHSDTNLIVHLSADRSRALVVWIPRALATTAQNCADPRRPVANGEVRQWNYKFKRRRPGCVAKTVEGPGPGSISNYFMIVDFAASRTWSMFPGASGCTAKDMTTPTPNSR